jgi:diguanylate cyclase (GGDEF)-like protein
MANEETYAKDEAETAGTWLCPTDFDRTRMLDMEARLQGARAVMFGALVIGFAVAAPWIGWAPAALVVLQVCVYWGLKPFIASSSKPEYPIAFAVVLAQVLVGVGVAVTGGTDSPVLLVFLLGIVGLPVRFGRTRVVAAGVILTEFLIFAATAGAHPSAFADNPASAIVTGASCFGLAAFAVALMQAESQKRSESIFDPLTGLPNRRGMISRFEELGAGGRRLAMPVAVLLCDLDHFKSINDRHGHQRGDVVLVETGAAIRRALRPTEEVFRVGGEEFLVLLPNCDVDQAAAVAERVRVAIEKAEPGGLPVTASVGVAVGAGRDLNFDGLFSGADAALYDAKRAGRNRIAGPLAVAAPA